MSQTLRNWLRRASEPASVPWKESDEEDATRMPTLDENKAVRADPLHGLESRLREVDVEEDFSYRGGRDSGGLPHGEGATLKWAESGDSVACDFVHGVREGEGGVVSCPRRGVSRLCGTFRAGKLEGRGKMIGTDTSVTDCIFRRGVSHGPARRIEIRKFREFRQQLAFLGRHANGRPWGPCWLYKEGGGFLFGRVDESGEFSGDSIAYIYPDLSTAYVGEFLNGEMVRASPRRVAKVTWDGHVPCPAFSTEDDRDEPVGLSPSTRTSLGESPTVPDPYESVTVAAAPSCVPGAGVGLFAARDLPAGTVAAFYNGVRIPYSLGGPAEEWATSGYKIFVNADFVSGLRMDVPPEMTDTTRYCATLGHKVNHSFLPNCEQWFFDHPRFGTIPCQRVVPHRDVAAGEELTMDYEYDPYNCPDWFVEALARFAESATDDELDQMNPKYDRFVRAECGRDEHRRFVFQKFD